MATEPMENLIEIRNLTVGYGAQIVLEHLDFTVWKGKITVVLGSSGGGKSTILKTLIGLLPPLEGEIHFHGVPVDYRSETAMARIYPRIGVLFQSSALLNSLTLYENVALPFRMHYPSLPENLVEEMVMSRLSQVGLRPFPDRYPDELSGGMRKRAALARAMILDPEIILCDEPSAGLDPITAAELDGLILSLTRHFKITFLVVTHELRSIETIADYAVVLHQGRMIYFGSYAALAGNQDPFIGKFFLRG